MSLASDKPFVLVGGGGHCKSLLSALLRAGVRPEGIIDRDLVRGTLVLAVEVLGDDALLPELGRKGYAALVAVGSIRDNGPRAAIYERLKGLGFSFAVFIAQSAVVGLEAELGPGSVVLEAAVINAGARVGDNCIINTGAIVEHDVLIGAHVHLAPGACLGGGVTVGQGAFIGSGAVVKQGLSIGARAVVGAGAVVVKDVPEGAVVVGCPARVRRGG